MGSFHHSFGLETYVTQYGVKSVGELRELLAAYLKMSLPLDGKALSQAYEIGLQRDSEELCEYDESITAMRLTRETREANLKTGKAFVRMVRYWSKELMKYYELLRENDKLGNYSVVLGYAGGVWQMDKGELLKAFLFNSLNGMLQAGIKLIPLGQTESQIMLTGLFPAIEETAEEILLHPEDGPSNFAPMLDIASMRHETLYSRLYMS